jgi:hypothetical protein
MNHKGSFTFTFTHAADSQQCIELEPEGTLLCSQELAIDPCYEPVECSLHSPPISFRLRFILIFSSYTICPESVWLYFFFHGK